jgi:hypothetical protein
MRSVIVRAIRTSGKIAVTWIYFAIDVPEMAFEEKRVKAPSLVRKRARKG